MARSVVVFPHPDGPNKQMTSPFRADREIPSSANEPVSYEQATSCNSSTMGVSLGGVIDTKIVLICHPCEREDPVSFSLRTKEKQRPWIPDYKQPVPDLIGDRE